MAQTSMRSTLPTGIQIPDRDIAATKCLIGCYCNQLYRGIVCDKGGEPAQAGRVLSEHYRTLDKIECLLDLGDLYSLGPDIGIRVRGLHSRDQCVAKHRDGAESLIIHEAPSLFSLVDIAHRQECSWLYLYSLEWDVINLDGFMRMGKLEDCLKAGGDGAGKKSWER